MASAQRVERYSGVRDRRLAARLSAEDRAEARGLDPFDRLTCRTHRHWVHSCVSSAAHVVVVTGHRWCRDCERPVPVVVDELAGEIRMCCPSCGRFPDSPANRQLLRACRRSLAAARSR